MESVTETKAKTEGGIYIGDGFMNPDDLFSFLVASLFGFGGRRRTSYIVTFGETMRSSHSNNNKLVRDARPRARRH
jgi:hypothetical protein